MWVDKFAEGAIKNPAFIAIKASRKIIITQNAYHMSRIMPARKRIALVAHDNKKDDLLDWAIYNRDVLAKHELFGTGTTGRLVSEALNLPVTRLLSGPLGGDQQIGALIAEGKVDVLIFFWDPMEALPHDPDIKALLRLGVVWNIPIACGRSSADFLLTSPLMHQAYEPKLEDYSNYRDRKIAKASARGQEGKEGKNKKSKNK
jgi:methylglyoxal synthase